MRTWHALRFHTLALTLALLFAGPALWVINLSLQVPGAPPRALMWLPTTLHWVNYRTIFELLPLGRYLLNSVFVVLLAVPLTIIVASWAAFAIAQFPPHVRAALLVTLIVLRMVPANSLWLTRFLVLNELQLVDRFAALLAPAWMGTSPFFVLLFYWSFRRMPSVLIEAARLDGLGPLGIWARVGLPLARPATVAVGVLAFVHYWSDFLSPLLYLKSEERYTLTVGVRTLQQLDATNWPLVMAGVVLLSLPIIVVFVLVQRAFWLDGRIAGMTGN
jgi:multiple sugar transport system permease protein